MSSILTNYQWIDEQKAANQWINLSSTDDFYPVDTEFERTRTFYLNPALLQIWQNQQAILVDLIDPILAKSMLSAIDKVIMHSASEDLLLWQQLTGKPPQQIFDTQVAASLCGYGLHYSYQNLVKATLNIELTKSMSRSDWLARPLTDAQIQYAIEDIAYLAQLKAILQPQLEAKGLGKLFEVLMQQLLESSQHDQHQAKTFQKIVRTQRFQKPEQAKLWLLLEWREQQAKTRNKPRNWILNPQQLIDICRKVKNKSDLFYLGLHPKFVKKNAEKITQLINRAERQPPTMPPIIKLTQAQGKQLKQLQQQLKQQAQKLNIEPALIANTETLKTLSFNNAELTELKTWRAIAEL